MEYIIGIDSGGTSSNACLAKGNEILVSIHESGMNPYAYSSDDIKETLSRIIYKLLELSSLTLKDLSLITVCGAGLSRKADQLDFLNLYKSLHLTTSIAFTDDIQPLLIEHFEKDPGILLVCGTGSIAYGKSQDQLFRSGGYGHLLSDEGSGYWLGLQALKNIYKSLDTGLESPFLVLVLKNLELESTDDLLKWVYQASKCQIANLGSLVITHKSEEAKLIMNQAGQHLISLIKTVLEAMSHEQHVPKSIVLSGSILKHSNLLRQMLINHFTLPVKFTETPAEYGAIKLGHHYLETGNYYNIND